MSLNFVFIGAGNLATQLSVNLKKEGYNILQIFSRTESSAKTLAEKLDTAYTVSTDKIFLDADVYFIAINDSAFQQVLPKINFGKKIVVHCAGSIPLSALKKYATNYGVFYPLQTFSKQRDVNFENIPVFIEANSEKNKNILLQIANTISNSVNVLDSEKRKYLHIAAIFACNFVNHLFTVSSEILNSKEISFEVLIPLIMETALKVQEMEPEKAQTGPAVRFDENIISDHLNVLKGVNNYSELYNSISKSIFEHHQKIK